MWVEQVWVVEQDRAGWSRCGWWSRMEQVWVVEQGGAGVGGGAGVQCSKCAAGVQQVRRCARDHNQ